MTAVESLVVAGAIAVLVAGFALPVLAQTGGRDHWLRRALVRRWDLLGGLRPTGRPGDTLLEAASARARGASDLTPTALSPRFLLSRSRGSVTSRATRHRSPSAARTAATAPLRPEYLQRYQCALADEAARRGLEVRECWVVVEPAREGAHPAITAAITTWLEVAPAGRAHPTLLHATEAVLLGGEITATVTAVGLDVLAQGGILDALVAKVAGRLPTVCESHVAAIHSDWLAWPHGA